MKKKDELERKDSCLSKARDDEMLFVLLQRDPSSPAAIRAWVQDRLVRGLNQPHDPKIVEARRTATLIERSHTDLELTDTQARTFRDVRASLYEARRVVEFLVGRLLQACEHMDGSADQCPVCRVYEAVLSAHKALEGIPEALDAALNRGPHPNAAKKEAP